MGLVGGHAYSILCVLDDDSTKLVQIRNPWGDTEWKGDWSDKSTLWTPELKELANWKDEDDGTFWMNMTDFRKYFYRFFICKYEDNFVYSYQ